MSNAVRSTRIAAYCALRLPSVVAEEHRQVLTDALVSLSDNATLLPFRHGRLIYSALSLSSGLDIATLRRAHTVLLPLVASVARARAAPVPSKIRRTSPRPRTTAIATQAPPFELPARFDLALAKCLALHGDSAWRVAWALRDQGMMIGGGTLKAWASGRSRPRGGKHWPHLRAIAVRYGLAEGSLIERLSPLPSVTADVRGQVSRAVREDLAWHLPDDFETRNDSGKADIFTWLENTLGSGTTDYRRYLQDQLQAPYALPLRETDGGKPERLREEIDALMTFKTAAFVPIGWQRNGVWNAETATQKRTQLGQMFGALNEMGMKPHTLTLGLLVLPHVWDQWLRWREQRRGFYIAGEADALRLVQALARPGTGWLRQSPHLAQRLRVIRNVLGRNEITAVRADWGAACDRLLSYARGRASDLRRAARVHRDPFEPILPVLEADSPIGEYRKICDEIVRRMPDANAHPIAAAEAARSLIMLRLGLHLGLRQKNLRELLLCPPGRVATAERKLETLRRGELRWLKASKSWEVIIPASAFKNGYSSFFHGRPYRVLLRDIGGLYDLIGQWTTRHRPILVGAASEPGTVFVATSRGPGSDVSLGKSAFYNLWRQTIARYGVYNPYTGRGAIAGLLPHGPHGVRDVLATHVLKATGSYEHAGYAIQDTAETVAHHYGRFLPGDKTALAAQIINEVWSA